MAPPQSVFDVGICTTGRSSGVEALVREVLETRPPRESRLGKVIVAASDCPPGVVSTLDSLARDGRIQLLTEDKRRGKADAINKILDASEAELLVLVNSDSHPSDVTLGNVLGVVLNDPWTGVASARPVPEGSAGVVAGVVDLMWSAHNESALALNHLNISNHSSDEFVVLRRSAISRLPEGLVNDGAFFAVRARRRGFRVRFVQDSRVGVEAPSRISGVIGQRRRILYGHAQVWRNTGVIPKTIESMIVSSPRLGLGLLVRTLARRPKLVLVLPVAVICEAVAGLLSLVDSFLSPEKHVVWTRYE